MSVNIFLSNTKFINWSGYFLLFIHFKDISRALMMDFDNGPYCFFSALSIV